MRQEIVHILNTQIKTVQGDGCRLPVEMITKLRKQRNTDYSTITTYVLWQELTRVYM